jgi:hypothetical protein
LVFRNKTAKKANVMSNPLIAVVGDITPDRKLDLPLQDPEKAKAAAEQPGAELAHKGVRLLVYGGPFPERDIARGFAI